MSPELLLAFLFHSRSRMATTTLPSLPLPLLLFTRRGRTHPHGTRGSHHQARSLLATVSPPFPSHTHTYTHSWRPHGCRACLPVNACLSLRVYVPPCESAPCHALVSHTSNTTWKHESDFFVPLCVSSLFVTNAYASPSSPPPHLHARLHQRARGKRGATVAHYSTAISQRRKSMSDRRTRCRAA